MTTDTQAVAGRERSEPEGLLALWFGVLAGPIAFLLNLQLNYMLTPWVCERGGEAVLHVVPLIFLVIVAAAGWVSLRNWRRTGSEWRADGGGVIPRSRFMAVLGVLTSILFVLVILAQWIPNLFLSPCQ